MIYYGCFTERKLKKGDVISLWFNLFLSESEVVKYLHPLIKKTKQEVEKVKIFCVDVTDDYVVEKKFDGSYKLSSQDHQYQICKVYSCYENLVAIQRRKKLMKLMDN